MFRLPYFLGGRKISCIRGSIEANIFLARHNPVVVELLLQVFISSRNAYLAYGCLELFGDAEDYLASLEVLESVNIGLEHHATTAVSKIGKAENGLYIPAQHKKVITRPH